MLMNKRICFHQKFGQETYPLSVAEFSGDNKTPIDSITKVMNYEEVLNYISFINEEYLPDASPFELLRRFVKGFDKNGRPKEVCIESFSDPELGVIIDLEDTCNSYRALPYEGGVFDQPVYLMEAFNIIRSVKNKYNNAKLEEAQKKAESNNIASSVNPKSFK